MTQFTVPGLTDQQGAKIVDLLQKQLNTYNGVIEDTRRGISETEELDPVTQDILIDHAAELEKFQWFVRAHLENAGGALVHEGSSTEERAAKSARTKS